VCKNNNANHFNFLINKCEDSLLYKYLIENQKYPFKKKAKFFIFNNNQYVDDILKMLNDVYQDIQIIVYKDSYIAFYFDNLDISVKDLFDTIKEELLIDLHIHDGMWVDSNTLGSNVCEYIIYVVEKIINENHKKLNTNVTDVIYKLVKSQNMNLLDFIKTSLLRSLKQKQGNLEILHAFFINNLNVSATAKKIYMHRNSLINKLNQISYMLNIDVQEFMQASALLMLILKEVE